MNTLRAVYILSFVVFSVFSSCTFLWKKRELEVERKVLKKDTTEVRSFVVKEIFREEPFIKVGIGEYRRITLEGRGKCTLLSGDSVISYDPPRRLRFYLKKGRKGKVLHWVGVGIFRTRFEAELLRQQDTALIVKKLGIYPRYYVLKGPFRSLREALRLKYPGKIAAYSILEVPPSGLVRVKPLNVTLRSPVVYRCDTVILVSGKKRRRYLGEMWVMPTTDARKLLLINRLKLEDYLKGVVPWEMSPSYPVEALKAQAIAARTHALDVAGVKWALLDDPYDITSDFTTQVYKGLSGYPVVDSVVEATRGIVLMSGDRFSIATFCTSCGGSLEDGRDWGDTLIVSKVDDLHGNHREFDLNELRRDRDSTVACSPAKDLPRILRYGTDVFRWSKKISLRKVARNVRKHLGVNVGTVKKVKVVKRTESGRVKRLLIVGSRRRVEVVGDWNVRQVLGTRSSLFTLRRKGKYLYIRGGGWGHGIGMCQVGAGVRAYRGERYEDILLFYYGNVEIVKLW